MRFALSGQLAKLLEEDGVVVLAPSGFLAAAITQDFADGKITQGIDSWRRPPVTTVETWLAERWQEARYLSGSAEIMLSASQEHLLWRSVIEENHGRLFDLNAAARLASQAFTTVVAWRIPTEDSAWDEHPDALQFLHWRRRFREICRREGWLTRADLWTLDWFKADSVQSRRVVFAGSHRLFPALRELRHLLGARAVDIQAGPLSRSTQAAAQQCDDFGKEIELAARWARLKFDQNPASSIAILLPNLAEHRSLVERTFRSVFYPSPASWRQNTGCVFHAAGGLLKDEPCIANALLFCKLAAGRITQSEAGAIFRSPFLAGAMQERSQRAGADLRLRRKRELDCSLDELRGAAQNCPIFSTLITNVERLLDGQCQPEAEIAEWSSFISDLLSAAGWPGDAELSVKEREALDGWKDALSQLASLGLVAVPMTFEAALSHLRRLLTRPGPATGDPLSPIQLLDWTQAPGLSFDNVFVAGLSEESRHPVSPLIPILLQRSAGVAGSSPASVDAERRRLTEALFGCARTAAATYSGTRPSTIAELFLSEGKRIAHWRGRLPWQSFKPFPLELADDTWAPPFENPDKASGGTRLIKAQSSCPFQAFATFRLRAERPEDASFGFNHLERGGFVHDALKAIWEQLGSQDTLTRMPPEELETLVEKAVHAAVESDGTATHRLLSDIERQRLQTVIVDWLAYEKARKIPFAVEAVEDEQVFTLAGLSLKLRIDRIDRLQNGRYVLIDYKSGEPKQNTLLGDRPSEPQLLVYAALLGRQVDGLFFGQLKPREPKLVGFARETHFTAKSSAKKSFDWNSFLASSIEHVEGFAREYLGGFAAVDPIKGACNYCPQKPFCRIQERGGGAEGEESE